MRFYRDSRFTKIALVLFFLIVIAYAFFEAQGLLFGPTITVTSDVTIMHSSYIVLRGHAEHISALSMNGREIAVTEQGVFEESYVLEPGINRIIFDAKDKYGRTAQKIVEIVYQPSS